jgi:nucleoid-associated protein YgaU
MNNGGNRYTAPATMSAPPAASLPPMTATASPTTTVSPAAAYTPPQTTPSAMPRSPGVATLGASPTLSTPYSAPPPATLPSAGLSTTATIPPVSSPTAASSPAVSSPPPVAAAPQAKPYVVAPGDNFWSIAQQAYGDGSYYRALYAYNSDRYPHAEDVRTGSVLDIPSPAFLKAKYPELCAGGGATIAAGGESPAMTGRANVAVAARTYVVQEGDTLFDIARRQLGKATYWSEIYNLNRAVLGENLQQLKAGTELMLPEIPASGLPSR